MGPHLGGPPSGAAPATGALASRCTRRPARTRWRCHRRPLWPGAPGGGPQRARQRPRVTTSPGRSLAQGLATVVPGRPSRMAPARRPAQVDGPTDSVTRVHSGIAWGCGGPCLAPPAGAVRLTAKTGLPTPGLSLAIGRYCLSESLRPTVVSRRKPGGPRPMRGQRSLPPHGVFSDLPCRADVVPGPYRGAGRHAGSAATPAVRAHHEGRVSLGANSAFALVTLISIVLAALQLAGGGDRTTSRSPAGSSGQTWSSSRSLRSASRASRSGLGDDSNRRIHSDRGRVRIE
jgi:hypothetical protein